MITIQKVINTRIMPNEERVLGEFAGLSIDAKPVQWANKNVDNGSVFREIDTGKTYLYDLENQRWIIQSGGGSGANIEPTVGVSYTENGNYTITPSSGYDGIEGANVIVDVPTNVNVQNLKVFSDITSNGSVAITPDSGYDAMGEVNFYVNVPSEANNETQSQSITQNGTYTYTPSQGYTGIGEISVDVNVSGGGGNEIDLTSGIKFGYSQFSTMPNEIVNANWEDITNGDYMFHGATIENCPLIDVSEIASMNYMFANCNSLQSVVQSGTSQLDTTSCAQMVSMFEGCSLLEDVPQFNTSNVITMQNMFLNCNSLTNTSLNNILAMCANVSLDYNSEKTLSYIGISATQAEICKTLSNYNDFVSAGWSTGYEITIDVDINAIKSEAGLGTYTVPEIGILDGYLFKEGITLTLNDPNTSEQIVGTINWQSFISNDNSLTFDINYNGVAQGNEYYFYNITYTPQV